MKLDKQGTLCNVVVKLDNQRVTLRNVVVKLGNQGVTRDHHCFVLCELLLCGFVLGFELMLFGCELHCEI